MVCDDGIGDYQHIITTAEQIKKDYPPVKIDIIPCFMNAAFSKNLKILEQWGQKNIICKNTLNRFLISLMFLKKES
jgi:ADP-heptose:LPS heptosyltransferase